MTQELQEELFYLLEYPEPEYEPESQLDHQWGESYKSNCYMPYGVTMERKCTRCGCIEQKWFYKRGTHPQVSHHRNGRHHNLELDGSLGCIDWDDNSL